MSLGWDSCESIRSQKPISKHLDPLGFCLSMFLFSPVCKAGGMIQCFNQMFYHHPPIHLPIHPPIHPYIHPSIHPSLQPTCLPASQRGSQPREPDNQLVIQTSWHLGYSKVSLSPCVCVCVCELDRQIMEKQID